MTWTYRENADVVEQANPRKSLVSKVMSWSEKLLLIKYAWDFESFSDLDVEEAAQALYGGVIANGISYDPAVKHNKSGTQIFRTLEEIESDKKANCLEMTLLFASCALRAELEPVFIELDKSEEPKHVIVGFWKKGKRANYRHIMQYDGTLECAGVNKRTLFKHLVIFDCSYAAKGSEGESIGLPFDEAVKRAGKQIE